MKRRVRRPFANKLCLESPPQAGGWMAPGARRGCIRRNDHSGFHRNRHWEWAGGQQGLAWPKGNMKPSEARRLAKSLREGAEASSFEASDLEEAFNVLLRQARRASIVGSRTLLALAGWLVQDDKAREKAYEAACRSPELALKCVSCGADQDACASTCPSCRSTESCGDCGECPRCGGGEWVRPAVTERLNGNRWE